MKKIGLGLVLTVLVVVAVPVLAQPPEIHVPVPGWLDRGGPGVPLRSRGPVGIHQRCG